jgi:hypothetical protein
VNWVAILGCALALGAAYVIFSKKNSLIAFAGVGALIWLTLFAFETAAHDFRESSHCGWVLSDWCRKAPTKN